MISFQDKPFCKSLTHYTRRPTIVVNIGKVPLGGKNSIRIQSMTNTPTLDVEATAQQCIRIAQAGADYVRITAQGVKEAEALQEIKNRLLEKKCFIPLIADIHFNPAAAEVAALHVEKVRINPGNFVDKNGNTDNTPIQHETPKELEKKLHKLIILCQQHNTALRIGVNHGSLSARMMDKYGDTPEGMVESAMEFLHICQKYAFNQVVLSMKSSNTRVMVYAYRLLAARMAEEGMQYPLHLGVTEAGNGEDGRVKSAVGIGTLLADGLGDTIRVSLTEAPEKEIPVAKTLLNHFAGREKHAAIVETNPACYFPYDYQKRESAAVENVGGHNPVAVVADLSHLNPIYQKDIEGLGFVWQNNSWQANDATPDAIYIGSSLFSTTVEGLHILSDDNENLLACNLLMLSPEMVKYLTAHPEILLIAGTENKNSVAELRAFFIKLAEHKLKNPVIIRHKYTETTNEALQLKAACDFGALLIDGFGDGLMISNKIEGYTPVKKGIAPEKQLVSLLFSILQASRVRFTKTEYIACPSCGRTLFDLEQTLAKVKQETEHLKGLKIAVMGCIVNGPGEMADADYGYVGAGPGKITLYKGKEIIKKNIPQEDAIQELLALIKRDKQ